MRLQRHLKEEVNEIPKKAWDLIQKKCKPFLREWLPLVKKWGSVDPLWRGIYPRVPDYGIKSVRKNRVPLGSNDKFHTDIDNQMQQKYKINGRTKCVFVSGDSSQAVTYGETYMIFPIGKYRYLWSPKVRDLWIDAEKLGYIKYIDAAIERELRKRKLIDGTPELIDELRVMFEYQNDEAIRRIVKMYQTNNLGAAIKSGNEIMIDCEEYVYLQYNWLEELEELIL